MANITKRQLLYLCDAKGEPTDAQRLLRRTLGYKGTTVANRPEKVWHADGYKSEWEAQYAARLEAQRLRGEILAWHYEAVGLKLAKGARYTPDFFVVLPGGLVEFHEVKGHWREAAKVRVKVARDKYAPIPLRVWRKDGGAWIEEET